MRSGVLARLQTEHELREALAGDQLLLHDQPMFDLRSGRAVGVEALLRWEHPERRLLVAGEFIELAESTGLIGCIGDGVVPTACTTRAGWSGDRRELVVWVNVSVRQLRRGFGRQFLDQLKSTGTSPAHIGVEVTESALATTRASPSASCGR